MKVIANIEPATNYTGGKWLVEIDASETAMLQGFQSWDKAPKLYVGAAIKVQELYNALQVERRRPDELKGMAKSLRDAADRVDSINSALASPIINVPT